MYEICKCQFDVTFNFLPAILPRMVKSLSFIALAKSVFVGRSGVICVYRPLLKELNSCVSPSLIVEVSSCLVCFNLP